MVAVVERFRHHAKKYRDAREAGHEAEAAQTFEHGGSRRSRRGRYGTSRGAAHFSLSNAAEQEHRVRRRRRTDGRAPCTGQNRQPGTLDVRQARSTST